MPHSTLFPVIFILQVIWFLAPGLGIALLLSKQRRLKSIYVVLVGATISCLLAYTSFWVYSLNGSLGLVFSWITAVWAGATLLLLSRPGWARKLLLTFDVIVPLLIWVTASLFYSSLLLSCRTVAAPTNVNQFCHTSNITFDNVLPELFAHNVYTNQPKALIGDWHGSDRPPLQAGATLMESPLTMPASTAEMSYLILAIFLQVLWIPAVWLLGRKLRLTNRMLVTTLILCLSSGFFLFNSVFTWPKLLAGSLGVVAVALLLLEKPTKTNWLIGSSALTLALLAHGGVAFTILPIGLFLLTKRYYPSWRNLLLLCLVFVGLYVPWSFYQHVYDPPGDRVLKWEIGGFTGVDERSFSQTLKDSYGEAGIRGTLHNKAVNAQTIIYASDENNHLYANNILGNVRDMEFRFVFFGLGLMNLGWLVLLSPKARQKLRSSQLNLEHLKTILALCCVSIICWTIIIFGPGDTIIHQGSYLTMILFFTLLATLLQFLNQRVLRLLLTTKLLYFIIVWVALVYLHNYLSIVYVLLEGVSIIIMVYLFAKVRRHHLDETV